MDLYEAIRQLCEERDRLDRVIESLERLREAETGTETAPVPQARNRRGRKAMGAAERREVSERMKRYWAMRGKRKDKPPEATS